MTKILRISHLTLLLIALMSWSLKFIFKISFLAEIQVVVNSCWIISGLVLAFIYKKRPLKFYFYLFPYSLIASLILFLISKFVFALYLVIVLTFLFPKSPLFKSKTYVLKYGNNFISPTHNYEVYIRKFVFEEKVMDINLHQFESVEDFRVVRMEARDEIILRLNTGKDTVLQIEK